MIVAPALAVVLDVFSRRAVGWSVDRHLTTAVPLRALRQALADRPAPQMHHSDRGVQYASQAYVQTLADAGIAISMSRPAASIALPETAASNC